MRVRVVTGAAHGADRLNRAALSFVAVLLVAAGGYGLARGWGALGNHAASEAILLSSWRDFVRRNERWFWPGAAAVSVIAGLLGVRWLWAQLAPSSPAGVDLTQRGDDGTTVVRSAGAARAVAGEVETFRGVVEATARLTGDPDAPEVALRVAVADDCDLSALRSRIDEQALAHLQQALDLDTVAARVEFRLAPSSGRAPVR